ncbi:MAG: RICIN domain-containing protein [Sandaracinaceae bacterium]
MANDDGGFAELEAKYGLDAGAVRAAFLDVGLTKLQVDRLTKLPKDPTSFESAVETLSAVSDIVFFLVGSIGPEASFAAGLLGPILSRLYPTANDALSPRTLYDLESRLREYVVHELDEHEVAERRNGLQGLLADLEHYDAQMNAGDSPPPLAARMESLQNVFKDIHKQSLSYDRDGSKRNPDAANWLPSALNLSMILASTVLRAAVLSPHLDENERAHLRATIRLSTRRVRTVLSELVDDAYSILIATPSEYTLECTKVRGGASTYQIRFRGRVIVALGAIEESAAIEALAKLVSLTKTGLNDWFNDEIIDPLNDLLATLSESSAASSPVGKLCTIEHVASGKYLTPWRDGDGADLGVLDWNAQDVQTFFVEKHGDRVVFRWGPNRNQVMCTSRSDYTSDGDYSKPGFPLWTWSWLSGGNQRWTLDRSSGRRCHIYNDHSKLPIGLGGDTGVKVYQLDEPDEWNIRPVRPELSTNDGPVVIQFEGADRYLEISATTNGAELRAAPFTGSPNQQFVLTPRGDDRYSIAPVQEPSRVVCTSRSDYSTTREYGEAGHPLWLWEWWEGRGGANQFWEIRCVRRHGYSIANLHSGHFMAQKDGRVTQEATPSTVQISDASTAGLPLARRVLSSAPFVLRKTTR